MGDSNVLRNLIDTSTIQPSGGMEVQSDGNTPPPSDETFDAPSIDFELGGDSLDIIGRFSVGDSGTMFGELSFGVPSGGLESLTFGYYEGNSFGSVTYDLDSGSLSQHFEHNFGNGILGFVDITLSSDGLSATASVDWYF
jgi:hypothetical protein